jgi:hypothetical protein
VAKLKRRQVRDLQWLLSSPKNNRHGIDAYDGPIDGAAGPKTRAAWRKARWLLGFPQQSYKLPCTPGRYPYTRALLVPMRRDGKPNKEAKPLQAPFKKRRNQRVKLKPRPKAGGAAVVAWASKEVGVQESPPGSNSGTRVRYYQSATWLGGSGWPWCAAFVCRCWREVFGSSYGSAGAWDFTLNAGRRVRVEDIQAGDAVSYRTGSGHINIALGPPRNGRIPTIGGNESNGVRRSTWPTSMVYAACRHPKA